MNIVDLMANDVWTEGDIVSRTEAMISSRYGTKATAILNRKVTAAMIGQYVLTAAEQQDVVIYAGLCESAAVAGDVARKMMSTLSKVFAYEKAENRLHESEYKGTPTITVTDSKGVESEEANPLFAKDVDERRAAQDTVDGVSSETLVVVAMRHPKELSSEGSHG